MSQIEVPKVHAWVGYGPPADSIAVTKLHGWVLLIPGDDTGEGDTTTRQGFVYGQRVRRS